MQASGARLARRVNRPDRCKHLTACTEPFEELLASTGGVHRCSASTRDPSSTRKIKKLSCRSASNQRAQQQLDHVSGASLNAIQNIGQSLRKRGARLLLYALSSRLRVIFDGGTDVRVWSIYRTKAEAHEVLV